MGFQYKRCRSTLLVDTGKRTTHVYYLHGVGQPWCLETYLCRLEMSGYTILVTVYLTQLHNMPLYDENTDHEAWRVASSPHATMKA